MTTLLSAALGLLLQSTALLGFGLLALRLARRRGPAVQSLIGRATLAGVGLALLLAAPLTGHVRPLWHVTLPAASVPPAPNFGGAGKEPTPPLGAVGRTHPGSFLATPSTGAPEGPQRGRERVSDAAREEGAASSAPTSRILTSSPSRFGRVAAPGGGVGSSPALAAAWGMGTALLLLWLGVCQWHLTRLRRCACPVTSGPAAETLAALMPRPPALLAHPSVRSPFLAGLRRPAIFLPTTYDTDFDPAALRAILAHELAHLARRDNAWTLAARLLCALLWPQPLLWVLCRRLEQIGEDACDQAVLAQDCPPRAYADCLLTLAERHPLGRRERTLGAGVAPFRSSLGQRISRILDKGTHAMSTVTPRLRLTIAALTVAAALGGAFLVSSAPAQVSATSVIAPVQTGKSSLVGTWLCTHDDGTGSVIIFSTDGRFEDIGPWPGESRVVGHSYGSNQAIGHSYGPYTTDGPELRYIDTRVWVEGEKPWKTDPYVHTMNYDLAGNILTLRLKDKWVNVYHRVPAYTKTMIGIKPVAAAEAQPSAAPNGQLNEARFLAGLTPVQGPGIVVTLNDSKKRLPAMPPGVALPNIIHDTDINQVVNELKAAGAEAVAVNDQRLVATSSVRVAGPTVLINFVPVVPPFVIKAIGNPKTLAAAMNIPGGIATQLKAYDPAMFSVRKAAALTLPAYSGGSAPHYAKPVVHAAPRSTRDSGTVQGTSTDSPLIPVTGKAQRAFGYGLKMVLTGKPYCAAVKGSEAARVGIPSNAFDEVIAVNDQAISPSGPHTLALLQAPPPLHLLLRGRDNQARSYTLLSKALLSVPPLVAVQEWEIKDLAVKKAKMAAARRELSGVKQQTDKEVREMLPLADATTLTAAVGVEQRYGAAVEGLKFATQYKNWCRKNKNAEGYARAVQWQSEAKEQKKQVLSEEAKLFPATSPARDHLARTHALAVRLADTQRGVDVIEGIVSLTLSEMQQQTGPTL